MTDVAFIDTETTGLDPDLNPIWEIAVIVEGVEHCWRQQTPLMEIVADGAPTPNGPYASQWVYDNTAFGAFVHDQTDALTPAASVARFATLVKGRHLVGAVPSFDEERLRRLYQFHIQPGSTRMPWHYHLIDVEALAVGYMRGRSEHEGYTRVGLPWKSDDLSRLVGVEPPNEDERHGALADARWAKAIYEQVMGA